MSDDRKENEDGSISWKPFLCITLDDEAVALQRSEEVANKVYDKDGILAGAAQPRQLVMGMLFLAECSLMFQMNQMLPVAEMVGGTTRPLSPRQKRGLLEWWGTLFCGLSSTVPGICQAWRWGKENKDAEIEREAERVARLSANTNVGMTLMGELLKEEGIWDDPKAVPLNEDMAGLMAKSMGLSSAAVMKATMDEATAAKKAAGGDKVKAMHDVWKIAKAAQNI